MRHLCDGFGELSHAMQALGSDHVSEKAGCMDIRVTRTHELLRRAFEELLEERDFDSITVTELCERSTVRRATFYRHFSDRDAFFKWYLQTVTERFLAEIGNKPEELDLRSYVELMHRKFIDFLDEHRPWFNRAMGKTSLSGLLDMVIDQAAYGITEHVAAYADEKSLKNVRPELVGALYTGGMVHAMRTWLIADKPFSADELVRTSTDFIMRYMEAAE